jgi:hypothetical protein
MGSSVSNNEKCVIWRNELKTNPENFKRVILKNVTDSENIYTEEHLMMEKFGVDLKSNSKWINRSFPILNGLSDNFLDDDQLQAIKEKRKQTCIQKYGVDHPSKTIINRKKCKARFNTDDVRKRRGKSISKAWKNKTKIELEQITQKRTKKLQKYLSNQKNYSKHCEMRKRTALKWWVTVECIETNKTFSFFKNDSLYHIQVGPGQIMKRIRKVTMSPFKSKDGMTYRLISCIKKH